MKKYIVLQLFVLFVCLAQIATAQTAAEIIDKYVAARGGKEKLLSVKTIYMEGSREMMGNEVPVRVYKEQGKLSRTEFDAAGATGFMLVTEKEVWNFFPMRSKEPSKMPDEAVVSMQIEMDIAGPLINYETKGNKVELIGKDSAEGRDCFKFKLTTATAKEINYWLDAKTYLLMQSSTKGGGNRFGMQQRNNPPANGDATKRNEPREVYTLYKEYKAIDGILFPHNIETKMPNSEHRGGGGTTFDKIEINKPIEAKLYKPE